MRRPNKAIEPDAKRTHGAGIAGTIDGLDRLLLTVAGLLTSGGQLLLDSLDVRATVNPVHLAYHLLPLGREKCSGRIFASGNTRDNPRANAPLALRYGVLQQIDRDIWIAAGPSVRFLGFPYPTRMTVVRLGDGGLWVCSPIALDAPLAAAIQTLGFVRHLVSPNKLHHLFLAPWVQMWPAAKLYAAPGLARRRRDLSFHAELGDTPDAAWAAEIDQVIFHGSFAMEEVVFFHRASRTAIFTDLIQRFDPAHWRGWRRLYAAFDGILGPHGSTPREWRLSFWNRRATRAARQKTLAWNPQRVIIAHGEWVTEDGRATIERALRWMG